MSPGSPFPFGLSLAGARVPGTPDTPSAHGCPQVPCGVVPGPVLPTGSEWGTEGCLHSRLPHPTHAASETQLSNPDQGPDRRASFNRKLGAEGRQLRCSIVTASITENTNFMGFFRAKQIFRRNCPHFSPQTGSRQGLILFISHVDSGQFLNLLLSSCLLPWVQWERQRRGICGVSGRSPVSRK